MGRPRSGPCRLDGCEKPGRFGGVCAMHYARHQRTGTYELTRVRGRRCDVDGCERSHHAGGYCNMHSTRVRKHGDAAVVGKAMHYGDEVGYVAAHARLRRTRGSATVHPCTECGGPAAHWAYDHTDPNEKIGADHGAEVPFSTDPARYQPMCVPCHKAFDLARL